MALKEYDFNNEPTVSIVKKILTDSIKMKATDIHFDPQPNDLLIKFRINSNLVEYTVAPESVKINILTRIKILANMNITESLVPQIGSINFDVEGTSTNMRVSSLPVSDGEKIVIHISNYAKHIKSISKIGMNQEDVNKIKQLIKEPQGILLITGTASSGKTTTMYSLLKELNNKSINIISIEDPIKMKIEGINQVQIAPEKGLTYKSLLRNILLQDPNVICINELIDDETARSALRASITGRLVISTMHTKSAYKTIETLLNMDVENYLIGSNLNGIISQRLVKKLCPSCRVKRKATDYEKNVIKYILNKDIEELYYPKGCTECQNGYTDQLPIIEVVPINEELRTAIANNKNRELIRNIIYEENNSILQDGFQKVIEGETSFDEIIRITDVKIDFTKKQEEIKKYILGNGECPAPEFNIKKDEIKDEEKIEKDENTIQDDIPKKVENSETKEEKNIQEEPKTIDENEKITSKEIDEPKEKSYYDEVEEEKKSDDDEIIKALATLEKESKEKVEEKTKEKTSKENDNKNDEEKITLVKLDEEIEEEKDDEKTKTTDDKPSDENNDNDNNESKEDSNTEENNESKDETEEDSSAMFEDDDEDNFNYGDSYSIF